MERVSRALRFALKHLKNSRGVSLYEITAAVAMTGILAAVAVPVIIDKVTEAKSARAVQETDAIYKAMQAFQKDTGKLPGQATNTVLLFSDGAAFPGGALGTALSTFCNSGGTGTTRCADMNRFLVGPLAGADATNYPGWKGPYVDQIFQDPFDRAYLVNVQALYAIDGVAATTPGGGSGGTGGGASTGVPCGFGWVMSAGPNRELETTFFVNSVNTLTSDDIGRNYGKKNPPGPFCTSSTQ